jgi:signal transduction histidine kinase
MPRSLYWRIAIGFVLFLAAMLVVQAVLFVWMVSRAGPALPGQPPDRFALTVARDLADELSRDPTVDLGRFVREQYGGEAHPFFVLMADGRLIGHDGPVPDEALRLARERLEAGDFDRRRPRREGGRGLPPPLPRAMRQVPIVVDGEIAGLVVVLPRAPFGYLLARYAPALALAALGVLLVGAATAAILIFGPARRRLRAVELAARRLGAGDLTARAPAHGGDEVAAVAAAFNAMADDLARRAEALAASDRARRQLLADVSHELNTPVTAMRGYLETLTMPELRLDEATRARYLGIVGDETARLERIVGDLLDLAKLDSSGGGTLLMDDVEIEPLFGRVVARHGHDAQARGVELIVAIGPGAERVRGDRDRLEQALQNLAANALRYAPRGTAVELRAERLPDGLTLTDTDRGPGIATEHIPHIFDRFYKVEASRSAAAGTRAAGGSGLGLSIVKAIVERHGGTVAVESEPGRTAFRMRFVR